jgi:predicted small metal-binding protein
MTKVFHCRDVGQDCDFVVSNDSEDDLIQQAYDHACVVHHCTLLLPEIEDKLRVGIHDEPAAEGHRGLLSWLFGRRPPMETRV